VEIQTTQATTTFARRTCGIYWHPVGALWKGPYHPAMVRRPHFSHLPWYMYLRRRRKPLPGLSRCWSKYDNILSRCFYPSTFARYRVLLRLFLGPKYTFHPWALATDAKVLRNRNQHTSTKNFRPDHALLYRYICIWRGEERQDESADPKSELLDKLVGHISF